MSGDEEGVRVLLDACAASKRRDDAAARALQS